jgi:hypothetical protein
LHALEQRVHDFRLRRCALRPRDAEQALGRRLMLEQRESDGPHFGAQLGYFAAVRRR